MTLFLYICKEYARTVSICLFGFVALAVIVDLFEHAGKFFKYNATLLQTFQYAALKAPQFLAWTIPVAGLMATLVTLSTLAQRSEITAMLAGGISRKAIAAPLVTMAILLCGAHYLTSEFVAPEANAASRRLMREGIRKKKPQRSSDRNGKWFYANGAFVRIGTMTEGSKQLHNVTMLRPREGKSPERIQAPLASWRGNRWVLPEGQQAVERSNGLFLMPLQPNFVLPLTLAPDELLTSIRNTDEWSFKELRRAVEDKKRLGQDVRKETVDLHGKFAFPLSSLVMCLVALPFGFRSSRSGGIARSIVTGLALGLGYWVVMVAGLNIGQFGDLPAALAAWLPNIIFGIVGVALATTLDRL